MSTPGLNVKKRQFFILLLFSVIVALLILRTGWVQIAQVVNGHNLPREAMEQQTRDRIVSSKRGIIFDRNKKELAASVSVDTISIIPSQLNNPQRTAEKLSELLELNEQEVLKKVLNTGSSIEIIKKRVELEKSKLVKEWITNEQIKGVKINEDTKRCYPYNNLASYVIGFTGQDNQGLDGLELTYEKILKGLPGRIVSETDVSGKDVPFGRERYINPVDGTNLILTIDETIQHFAERHLQNAIIDNKCTDGGIVIVMKPKTGEVLAMAVKPDFDLNNPFKSNKDEYKLKWDTFSLDKKTSILQDMWRNRAVSDTYEPGSTFKIVTSVAGLEENVVRPEENFTCTGFYEVVKGVRMRCWRYYRPHGLETFKQAVQNSCNPVFIEVGLRLGKEKLFKYINAFGLQDKTGIGLPGEAKGIFHDIKKVGPVELATISFGQRIQVTPIELITAVSAVANGGKLMKPQLVKELQDKEGNIIKRFEPQAVRQVISSETSAIMRDIMESVVSEGTGKNAYVKGYRVAGKTGTADQGVNTNIYVASFVGFAPADNPEVSVLVVLSDPKGDSHMGGVIAAPVVGKIMEDILPYLKIEPKFSPNDVINKEVKVPEVRGKKLKEAKEILRNAELEYRVNGQNMDEESIVREQSPKPDIIVSSSMQVILFTDKESEKTKVKVPDLKNKNVLEATRILKDMGLNIRISGSGEAFKQEPISGTQVELGTEIKVEFNVTEVD